MSLTILQHKNKFKGFIKKITKYVNQIIEHSDNHSVYIRGICSYTSQRMNKKYNNIPKPATIMSITCDDISEIYICIDHIMHKHNYKTIKEASKESCMYIISSYLKCTCIDENIISDRYNKYIKKINI